MFCAAKIFDCAHIAPRLSGNANERAKIEECRVESRGIGFRENTRCVLPKEAAAPIGIDRFAQIEKSG